MNRIKILARRSPKRCLFRCTACWRTLPCGAGDLARYGRDGWPTCCGQVMHFAIESAA